MRRPKALSLRLALAFAVGPLLAGVSSADSIKLTSGVKYPPVTIVGAADGMVHFRIGRGRVLAKPLKEVAEIAIAGNTNLNRAEQLFQKGKYAEAAASYGAAATAAAGWRKTLIRYRLLAAHEKAEQIDKAVKLWLEMVDAAKVSVGSVALRPRKLAPAGSPANDKAMATLTAKAKKVTDANYLRAIRSSLVDLYERQGRLAEAQAMAALLEGKTTTRPGGEPGPRVSPTGSTAVRLRRAGLALKAGEYRKVINFVQPALKKCPATELPTALYLLGGAQLGLARAETKKDEATQLLLDAGLNLVRVVANFPASSEAPDALLLAGEVSERLKNFWAAKAAYSAVISRYSASPAAKKAKAARERIKDKE